MGNGVRKLSVKVKTASNILLFLFLGLVECKSKKNDIENLKIVKGIVSEKYGPLGGALIKVKSSGRVTQADWDGKFEIMVKEGDILIVTMVGFADKQIIVDNENYYEIILPPYHSKKKRKSNRERRREMLNGGMPEEEF